MIRDLLLDPVALPAGLWLIGLGIALSLLTAWAQIAARIVRRRAERRAGRRELPVGTVERRAQLRVLADAARGSA